MNSCQNLTSIDLSGLTNLQSIGNSFIGTKFMQYNVHIRVICTKDQENMIKYTGYNGKIIIK